MYLVMELYPQCTKGDNSQLNKTNYALTIIYDKIQSLSGNGLNEN